LFTANIRIMAVHFPLDNIKFPPIPNQEIEKYTRYTSIPVHNYKYVLYHFLNLSFVYWLSSLHYLSEGVPGVLEILPIFTATLYNNHGFRKKLPASSYLSRWKSIHWKKIVWQRLDTIANCTLMDVTEHCLEWTTKDDF
jgi:hypothetical protein